MQLVVDSLLVNYKKEGKSKKNVILIHGWADKLETFDRLADHLSKKYTVYRLDLPGFGKTQAPEEVWGLSDYALFIEKFTKKLGIKDVHAYIGHSNGGAVLIKGYSNGSLKSEKLVLLAASGIRGGNSIKKLIIKFVAKIGKLLTFWLPLRYKQKLQKFLYGTVGSDFLVAPHLKETFKKTIKEDVQNDAKKIDTETLIIYGLNDSATPHRFGDVYNNLIKKSKLIKIDNAGHMLHQHQPDEVAKEIGKFL